ncbi:YbjQ family protein [Hathewaya limosa]|uniref:UPF0145 protein QOZ93_001081 n=1 Tax=Hathewaya limosa TaxID=1536 RepID=A0ABU0JQJ5_HATLI|nr:YbjQ family protein [Hathewaya limosa]AWZ48030.1 hypothetical protein C3495_04025 [Clostridiaceae bacterium 14S0207]MDQ0479340.1 uncharacterized protein YbjQ (UPF0145 family) [Hathewaya limosa]
MILVTTDSISGCEMETIQLVKGSTIQCKNFGSDFLSGLKNLVGGELKAYTDMMNEARRIATERMIAEAQGLGANAIVGIRYTTSSVAAGAAEVIVYGTAVKIR